MTISLIEKDSSSTVIEVIEEGFDTISTEFLTELIDNKEGWVYTLTCLKAYLEYRASLRAALVK